MYRSRVVLSSGEVVFPLVVTDDFHSSLNGINVLVNMGKKKGKDRVSREEEDVALTGPSCRHIKKGTDQTLLKKLSGNSDWATCQDCKQVEDKGNGPIQGQDSEEEQETAMLWMCLKCGHRGCGRNSENQHAIKHYETPHSDPHCLVISLDSWSVWCYICDDEVEYSRTGQLSQLVTNLRKQTPVHSIKRAQEEVKVECSLLEEVEQKSNRMKAEEREDEGHPKKNAKKESVGRTQKSVTSEDNGVSVKGLSNLGNTCFFNAVIQNLSQTQLFREIINQVTEEKLSLDIKPVASSGLEPIGVQLEQPGSLTLAMCQLLNEIQGTKRSVVTPQELFAQVCKKAPRFKGFQQQDSHELLRYLLDGMRTEEIKRVNCGITEALKESGKSIDGEQLKSLLREYEKNGVPKNFVDHVFGGEMTSTIMCQQCKMVSVVSQMFLDLSLPVSDEACSKKNQKKGAQNPSASSQDGRNSPALACGNDDVSAAVGSKYQHKKAKKQAKKQAKHQKRQQKLEGRVTLDSLTSPDHAEGKPRDPAADATENADGEMPDDSPSEGDPAQISASEQDQKSLDTLQETEGKEEDEESVADCDDSAASSVNNRFTVLSEEQHSKDSVIDSDGASAVDREEDDEDDDDDMRLVSGMERVNLNDAFVEEIDTVEPESKSDGELPEAEECTGASEDPELVFQTLATRKGPEKQELSVHSCLFQFTAVETLTQDNSLLCVTCTKRQPNDGSKKGIYTDALKQVLISSPPPVLTLYFKRFQQKGHSISKVNRHVQFPVMLDLAPFCAVKCKNVTKGEVLYSLYGIIEHGGTMRSGHYTAYVKVRPGCPKPSSIDLASDGDAEPPKGSWCHVSDTSVQQVSESKVLSCQAYLLFYERVA